jgi:acyl-CoA synthetase (AMP-forming)/AMP-acid ligase II
VFEPAQVLARIAADRVTVLPGPPTLYQAILAQPDFASYDVSSLRLAVTGAASIPLELIHRMKDVLGLETVITGYGLTETCGVVAMCRFDDDVDTIATTSGRAIDGVEMRTVDRAGAAVAPGEPGEIVVRGYNVMQGYFEDEAATHEAIDAAGWLHTGDIGVIDARGYVRVTDRQKDMFIMGGFNCYPAEIENQILAHPDVHQVAVIGVPDQRMGEVGMAFVVPRPGAALDGAALSTWCRAQLANYKVPRHIQLVAALPINATGKVMKYLLREQASQRLAAEP